MNDVTNKINRMDGKEQHFKTLVKNVCVFATENPPDKVRDEILFFLMGLIEGRKVIEDD